MKTTLAHMWAPNWGSLGDLPVMFREAVAQDQQGPTSGGCEGLSSPSQHLNHGLEDADPGTRSSGTSNTPVQVQSREGAASREPTRRS